MYAHLSKIGPLQIKDIEDSSGIIFYDKFARVCSVIKQPDALDNREDKSPYRMAELFGRNYLDYNNHFIVQVAGCPFHCPFCYVDNKKQDAIFTAKEIVAKFRHFRRFYNLNVLHLMGGAPGFYCEIWPELRQTLDDNGFSEVILFSDVILVENHYYGLRPWQYLNLHHFMLTGGLKGTSVPNFVKNTGMPEDLYKGVLEELRHYIVYKNFYCTCINYEESELDQLYQTIPKEKVDLLQVVNYEACKQWRNND